ncbi:MAG: hypothetical protein E6189_17785 [Clostridium sp.]|uniref:hypothetical protein n=1 Tax=Clostridium sp. TaxID=1506 RepID=UPI002911B3B0|nr:hypothetical protein [Clostridium sp.]MDU5211570.1 hypothetical protein [Clostridium sp.]
MKNLFKKIALTLTFVLSINTIPALAATNESTLNNSKKQEINFNPPEAGTISYLSDKEVVDLLIENGYDIDVSQYKFLLYRSNGYNKIVWKNDGFDLYISKNTILILGGAGVGALGVIMAAFPPLAGATGTIVLSAISMYVGGNITDGKIFRFKYRNGNKLDPYLSSVGTQY